MRNYVHFVVGNTYREIQRADSKLDPTGTYRKIHDWCLYLDIIDGNPDSIQSVQFDLHPTFSPYNYICQCPIPTHYKNYTSSNNERGGVPTTVWRFQTRQQSYDSFTATLTILGCSGSQLEVKYHIQCGGQGGRTSRPILFLENRLQRLSMIQLRLHQRFGIELEIEVTSSVDSISNALISELKGMSIVHDAAVPTFATPERRQEGWRLIPEDNEYPPDPIYSATPNDPKSSKARLIPPLLKAGLHLPRSLKSFAISKSFACIRAWAFSYALMPRKSLRTI